MHPEILGEKAGGSDAIPNPRLTPHSGMPTSPLASLGRELPMASDFDDFSEKAAADYPGGSEEQRQNRDKRQAIMTRHGFDTFPHEWWHFDWKGWQDYAPLDISFKKLAPRP
jgi:D-alanyl-D-alanine dipeptidase